VGPGRPQRTRDVGSGVRLDAAVSGAGGEPSELQLSSCFASTSHGRPGQRQRGDAPRSLRGGSLAFVDPLKLVRQAGPDRRCRESWAPYRAAAPATIASPAAPSIGGGVD
jgi:hypothetical protein